uniref:Periplasmic heavy metal sensor n=2 Tax=Thermoanaerobaculum aquaticum TaxID=1312852 RepID=A0A7C2N8I1_9BACT
MVGLAHVNPGRGSLVFAGVAKPMGNAREAPQQTGAGLRRKERVMTKKVFAALAFLVAGSLWAQGLGGPPFDVPAGRWWDRPAVAQELGLSPEQKAKLEQLTAERVKAMIDARAAVQKAEVELRLLAEKEPLDVRKVREAFAALQQARQKLELERFEMLLAVRQTLSTEQWNKLRTVVRERLEERRERREGRRPEPGPRRPQDF